MKTLILTVFLLGSLAAKAQKPLLYKGKIGPYPIEVQFTKCDTVSGKFEGKYRYAKKKNYLQLSGQLYSPVLLMDEISGTDTTGQWYLEMDGDSLLGYWSGKTRGFELDLVYVSGDRNFLTQQSLEDLSKKTNDSFTGTYKVDYNFINTMWLSEENYTPEIGYNGGTVTIKELDKTHLEFQTEMICGPTYHFAMAGGIAEKQEDYYLYKNEEGCQITIRIQNKKLQISASETGFSCGFGARAYLDHELIKINNKVIPFQEY